MTTDQIDAFRSRQSALKQTYRDEPSRGRQTTLVHSVTGDDPAPGRVSIAIDGESGVTLEVGAHHSVGGDPDVMRAHLDVNVMGVYLTVRAAGPHVSHAGGYVLVVSSLAAAVNAPLLGAYSASKAAVEAIGNTLRAELAPTGARVGVAYFAERDIVAP